MGPQNSFPLFQVDAFTTNKAFSGNPAAVCLLETPQDAAWMQAVEVDLCSHATLALAPDFPRLKTVDMRGVIVTAPADEAEFDLVSRFFAPAAGIDEDPVTGSAHCALYPFWRERLNKSELTAYQASSRGGRIKLRGQGGRVTLTGQAVTVMSGALHV